MGSPTLRSLSLLFTIAVFVLPGCDQSHGGSHQEQPAAAIVVVSQPVEKSVTDYVDYTGRTDAAESVEIRARVTGFLNAVLFKDGAEVEKGAPLFEIDDREYQADLDSARAELASAKAHQEKATTDFKRMETLKQKGAASAEEYDRADAAKKEADAAVESGAAKQTRAQLNVDFSKIAAPIAGKISRPWEAQVRRVHCTRPTRMSSVAASERRADRIDISLQPEKVQATMIGPSTVRTTLPTA